MKPLAAAIALTFALHTGCAHLQSAGDTQLRAQAAGDLRCASDSLQVIEMGWENDRVEGCGRENVYAYSPSRRRWLSPLDVAVSDLSCPKEALEAQDRGGIEVNVSGCTKRAVYRLGRTGWVASRLERGNPTEK